MGRSERAAAPIRFQDFELNLDSGELQKNGIRLKLQDQPFKVLSALVQRPGQVVTNEELHEIIQPQQPFNDSEHSINLAVDRLRSALGDSAEVPHLIEILPRGYRFIASVEKPIVFGPFEADLHTKELRKFGVRLNLPLQSFQILAMLLQRPGELVSRDELQQALWPPGTIVDFEHCINAAVNKLREAFVDSADNPKFIETLPRRGYRFIGSVETHATVTEMAVPKTESGRMPRWVVAASAGVIVLILAAIMAARYWPRNVLTEKDSIVLADFTNKTGDPVFDDALKQAFEVELEQSPFLNVVSSQKVSATLRMMGRSPDARVTVDAGREVCFRTGSKALLGGSITSLGSHFVINLDAIACATGDTLAKAEGEAGSKEEVLKALGQATANLRRKLGESLPSVQRFDVPAEATTSSLEALKNYSMGLRVKYQQGEVACIPFLKRATELDPNLAVAYADLGAVYFDLDQPSLALEYTTKAYNLRDRGTEKEKWYISAGYFRVTGQLDEEAKTYELWIASYPRDPVPHADLGLDYFNLAQFQKAVNEDDQALQLAPDLYIVYENRAAAYLALGREEQARASLDQALAHHLDGGFIRKMLYYLAFLHGDNTQMEQQVGWGAGKPGDEDPLLSQQSDTEAYHGRLRRSRDFSRRAVESALRANSPETAASHLVEAALREAQLENTAEAQQAVERALKISPSDEHLTALTLALVGDASRARTLAGEVERNSPTDTLLRFYWLPTIRSAIELRRENPQEALKGLEPVAPYDLVASLESVYLRGESYLQVHDGAAAAAEFQKLLDHRGIVLNSVTGALSHLQIARAYAMTGDTPKAKASYQQFFTLWKDADPDIPIFKRAKAEYAKL